jgi:DNA replicative helicase MCM subunit Mcm2 (Cdc46/Mcm family)
MNHPFEVLDPEVKKHVRECQRCRHDHSKKDHYVTREFVSICECCADSFKYRWENPRPLILFNYVGGIRRGHFTGVSR